MSRKRFSTKTRNRIETVENERKQRMRGFGRRRKLFVVQTQARSLALSRQAPLRVPLLDDLT